jgi:hypothetical protein
MKQTDPGLNLATKRTRKREFLAQMQAVVPWAALVDLIAPYYGEGKNGRPTARCTARKSMPLSSAFTAWVGGLTSEMTGPQHLRRSRRLLLWWVRVN